MPTTESIETDGVDKYSDDDKANAFIVNDSKGFTKVDASNRVFVINSITRYLSKAIPAIQDFFQKNYGIAFQETQSLWFRKEAVFFGGRDLLSTVNSTDCKIAKVKFDFSSWTVHVPDARFSLKMDLLFELVKEGDEAGGYFTAMPEKKLQEKRSLEKALTSELLTKQQRQKVAAKLDILLAEFADTAVPCPPAKCPK